MIQQLCIFDFDIESNDNYKRIKKQLSKYSIDAIYEKEFKGQWSVFNVIKKRLEQQEDYKDYMNELIKELTKTKPVEERTYGCDRNIIWKTDDTYGYNTNINTRTSSPFYCIDMIPKAMFEELSK